MKGTVLFMLVWVTLIGTLSGCQKFSDKEQKDAERERRHADRDQLERLEAEKQLVEGRRLLEIERLGDITGGALVLGERVSHKLHPYISGVVIGADKDDYVWVRYICTKIKNPNFNPTYHSRCSEYITPEIPELLCRTFSRHELDREFTRVWAKDPITLQHRVFTIYTQTARDYDLKKLVNRGTRSPEMIVTRMPTAEEKDKVVRVSSNR